MEKKRTLTQNKALHKLFAEVAKELLDQGIERKTVLNALEGYSVPVDEAFMKEVWRAIQFTQTGKKSTTQLNTDELDRVYETFNRFLSEEYNVYVPFPSMDALASAYLNETHA